MSRANPRLARLTRQCWKKSIWQTCAQLPQRQLLYITKRCMLVIRWLRCTAHGLTACRKISPSCSLIHSAWVCKHCSVYIATMPSQPAAGAVKARATRAGISLGPTYSRLVPHPIAACTCCVAARTCCRNLSAASKRSKMPGASMGMIWKGCQMRTCPRSDASMWRSAFVPVLSSGHLLVGSAF